MPRPDLRYTDAETYRSYLREYRFLRALNYGLVKNPCQGCQAYYAAKDFYDACQVEIDGACEWIRIYDTAIREMEKP